MDVKQFEFNCFVKFTIDNKLLIANAEDVDNPIQRGDKKFIKVYIYELDNKVCLKRTNEKLEVTAETHPDLPEEIEVESISAQSITQISINEIVINNDHHVRLADIIRISFDGGDVQILTDKKE